MTDKSDTETWEKARLIPVSNVKGDKEKENRATSALLSVLSAVDEFGREFTKQRGAIRGDLQGYSQVIFKSKNGTCLQPDGVIRITKGGRSWTALVEVKTGKNNLKDDQVISYMELAKERGYECVITISNQIAKIAGLHPVEYQKRKFQNVNLHHVSWSDLSVILDFLVAYLNRLLYLTHDSSA